MPRLVLAPALLLAACSGDRSERAEPPPAPPAPPAPAQADAAEARAPTPPPIVGGVTQLPTFDPASGFHLDEAPAAPDGVRAAARDRKPGQLLLRSSPAGAVAAVDGVIIGRTPVLWEGALDGQAHEFTFAMAGHALARYRFVPVTSGVVHGTLVKLTDDRDAGVPEIPAAKPAPR